MCWTHERFPKKPIRRKRSTLPQPQLPQNTCMLIDAMKYSILLVLFFGYTNLQASNTATESLVHKIVQRATEDEKESKKYGYDMTMEYRWLNRDGTSKKTETKNYRTVWLNDKPHLQLFQINGQSLGSNQIKEEEKTKKEWHAA